MMTRIALVTMLLALTGWSCEPAAKPAPGAPDLSQVKPQWQPSSSTHVQLDVQPLGAIPNSGLQLPVVSPDGQWLACVEVTAQEGVEMDSLFTGRELGPASLVVRELRRNGKTLRVCPSGACWPAWSPDSARLAFVMYGQAGRCELGVYELSTGQTRFTATGLRTMAMLTFSPSGRQVALAGESAAKPGSMRLFVVDLDTAKLHPGPDAAADWQIWPQWVSDRAVVFLNRRKDKSHLARWVVDGENQDLLCEVNAPASAVEGFQMFAGLGTPLSPDGRRLAYYDMLYDGIVIADLISGKSRALAEGTRAGCWLNGQVFAAATEKELLLFAQDATEPARLMRGLWLPRWGQGQTSELILCTRGQQAWTFDVLRVRATPGK